MAYKSRQNTDKKRICYCIAGLILELVFPEKLKREEILPTFEPFLVEYDADQNAICSIELSFDHPTGGNTGKLLSDVSVVWGERFCFYDQDNDYITTIRSEQDSKFWKMKSNKDFSESIIYILQGEQSIHSVLSWLIMVAFAQTCLLHQTILIHASVIALHGNGYAFLGKSGTGKSTHSRRWLEHFEDAQLLNDDNPAVRVENDGLVYVYGTPWSGKTACYKNMKVRMQAFVRLKQASYNEMSWKTGVRAFVGLLPSCTAIRWNRRLFAEMTNTVETIVQKIPVTELACLPNKAAARYCHNEILKMTSKQIT